MDIKTELIEPLYKIHEMLANNNTELSSVLSIVKHTIYPGFIATIPNNLILLDFIKFIESNYKKTFGTKDENYLVFTRDFYSQLSKKCDMKEGLNQNNLFLFM